MANTPRTRLSDTAVISPPDSQTATAIAGTNKTAQFFFYLTSLVNSQMNDQEVFEQIGKSGLSSRQLNQLLEILKSSFGLTREKGESLGSFLTKTANFFRDDLSAIGEQVGEKLKVDSVPAALDSMVVALKKRGVVIAEIKKNSGIKVESTINRWINQQALSIQAILAKQGIFVSPELVQQLSLTSIINEADLLKQVTELRLPEPSKTEQVVEAIEQQTQRSRAVATVEEKMVATHGLQPETRPSAQEIVRVQKESLQNTLKPAGLPPDEIEAPILRALAGDKQDLVEIVNRTPLPSEERNHLVEKIAQSNANVLSAVAAIKTSQISAKKPAPIDPKTQKIVGQKAIEQVSVEMVRQGVSSDKATEKAKTVVAIEKKYFKEVLVERKVKIPSKEVEVLISQSIAGNTEPLLEKISELPVSPEEKELLIGQAAKADASFLATRRVVAEEIRPVLTSAIKTPLSEAGKQKLAEDVATVMIAAKSRGLTSKDLAINQAAPQVALVLAAKRVELKQPLSFSRLTSATEPASSKIDSPKKTVYGYSVLSEIDQSRRRLGIGSVFDSETRIQLEQYLKNQGINTKSEAVQKGIMAASFLITQQETIASKEAITGPAGEVSSPLVGIKIPENPADLLHQFNLLDPSQPQPGLNFSIKVATMAPNELEALQEHLGGLIEHIGGETVSRNPIFSNIQNQYNIIEAVYNNPLYQMASPVIQWAAGFAKSEIVQRIAKTGFGKAVKKTGEKIINWGINQIAKGVVVEGGKRLAMEGVKKAAQAIAIKGTAATVAAALGVPTGGLSLLIWAGIELLQMGFKMFKKVTGAFGKLARMTGIPQAISELANSATFGLPNDIMNQLRKIPLIGNAMARGFSRLVSGITTTTIVVGTPILVAMIAVFGLLFIMQGRAKRMVSTLVIGGRGGGWIPGEGFPPNIIEEPIDDTDCQTLTGNARKACLVILVSQSCTPGGVNSSNVNTLRECVLNRAQGEQLRNEFSASEIDDMLDMFEYSTTVTRATYLQCVGFKRGIEPVLPDAGNGLHFADADLISPCYTINPDEVQSGDNAVWTHASYGHIAMVLDENYPSDVYEWAMLVAQAWGETGRINATVVPATNINQFIRCP